MPIYGLDKNGEPTLIDTRNPDRKKEYTKLSGTPFDADETTEPTPTKETVTVEETTPVVEEETTADELAELQAKYTEAYGKAPAAAYKNNAEWLSTKIDEATLLA